MPTAQERAGAVWGTTSRASLSHLLSRRSPLCICSRPNRNGHTSNHCGKEPGCWLRSGHQDWPRTGNTYPYLLPGLPACNSPFSPKPRTQPLYPPYPASLQSLATGSWQVVSGQVQNPRKEPAGRHWCGCLASDPRREPGLRIVGAEFKSQFHLQAT